MDKLELSYESKKIIAEKFTHRLKEQIEEILLRERVSLAFPIEVRVKDWASIKNKSERKNLNLNDVSEMEDFIGARIILHFKRDALRVCGLIHSTFRVLSSEDTQQRLGVNQFGYQSTHFQITLPEEWLKIPTFKSFSGLMVEVQVRTAAQHIWASVSHVLQYKQEQAVPAPVLRSINRVSALLETVDLEFERVLMERQEYRDVLDVTDNTAPLNVDILKAVMDSSFPGHASKSNLNEEEESYDLILQDLQEFRILTVGDLKNLIKKYESIVLNYDKEVVQHLKKHGKEESGKVSVMFQESVHEGGLPRLERGVYCSHGGIICQMLERAAKDKFKF